MLENYEKDFEEEKFVKDFMAAKEITTKSKAIAELRKLIKRESYYQDKIKKTLQKKYPGAFIRKITQGAYSEAGIPDILFIKDGHYFGFEVKRPVVGVPSKIQLKTIEKIMEAGGTAAIVVWPEQAIAEVEKYEKSKR